MKMAKLDFSLLPLTDAILTPVLTSLVTKHLGFDDDIVIGMVQNLLNLARDAESRGESDGLDVKGMGTDLGGFMGEEGASKFVEDLVEGFAGKLV